MSAPMRKPPVNELIEVTVHDDLPKKFIISRSNSREVLMLLRSLQQGIEESSISAHEVFKDFDKKYGKVGATIRGLRVRDELTQKALAEKLDIHQTHISQIEHGTRIVGKALAQKLAKVFNTDYRLFL